MMKTKCSIFERPGGLTGFVEEVPVCVAVEPHEAASNARARMPTILKAAARFVLARFTLSNPRLDSLFRYTA